MSSLPRRLAMVGLILAASVASAQSIAETDGVTPTASPAGATTTTTPSAAAPATPAPTAPAPAADEEAAAPREWFGQNNPWQNWTQATGDWNLTRNRLSERGIDFALSAASDTSRIDPSNAPTGTFGRGLFDAVALIDLEKLSGVRGAMIGVRAQAKAGPNVAPLAGDHQGFSNMDASRVANVYEVWWEQWILRERLQVKFGRMDSNNDFAGTVVGSDFINSSMGFSPTILFFPSFPAPRMAVNVMYAPHWTTEFRVGVYDGLETDSDRSPDPGHDLLLLAQAGTSWRLGGRPGRATAGLWHHTGTMTRLDRDELTEGATGPFATFEQTLAQRSTGAMRRLAMFAQYGSADARVHEIARHVGGGLVLTGPHARRADDKVGLGVTMVRLSDQVFDDTEDGWEVVTEAFYRFQLTKWFGIQPDVQFMRHGHDTAGHSGVFATCRLVVDF